MRAQAPPDAGAISAAVSAARSPSHPAATIEAVERAHADGHARDPERHRDRAARDTDVRAENEANARGIREDGYSPTISD